MNSLLLVRLPLWAINSVPFFEIGPSIVRPLLLHSTLRHLLRSLLGCAAYHYFDNDSMLYESFMKLVAAWHILMEWRIGRFTFLLSACVVVLNAWCIREYILRPHYTRYLCRQIIDSDWLGGSVSILCRSYFGFLTSALLQSWCRVGFFSFPAATLFVVSVCTRGSDGSELLRDISRLPLPPLACLFHFMRISKKSTFVEKIDKVLPWVQSLCSKNWCDPLQGMWEVYIPSKPSLWHVFELHCTGRSYSLWNYFFSWSLMPFASPSWFVRISFSNFLAGKQTKRSEFVLCNSVCGSGSFLPLGYFSDWLLSASCSSSYVFSNLNKGKGHRCSSTKLFWAIIFSILNFSFFWNVFIGVAWLFMSRDPHPREWSVGLYHGCHGESPIPLHV